MAHGEMISLRRLRYELDFYCSMHRRAGATHDVLPSQYGWQMVDKPRFWLTTEHYQQGITGERTGSAFDDRNQEA